MAWPSATNRYEGRLIKENPGPVRYQSISISITSVQIQHSLCIKVTLNNSGSISIIQCLLLYGLILYKCRCVLLLGACQTREETQSCGPLLWISS